MLGPPKISLEQTQLETSNFVHWLATWRISMASEYYRVPGRSCNVVCVNLHFAVSVEHRLLTDGRTDRQTHDDRIYRASIALRGKNQTRFRKIGGIPWLPMSFEGFCSIQFETNSTNLTKWHQYHGDVFSSVDCGRKKADSGDHQISVTPTTKFNEN